MEFLVLYKKGAAAAAHFCSRSFVHLDKPGISRLESIIKSARIVLFHWMEFGYDLLIDSAVLSSKS